MKNFLINSITFLLILVGSLLIGVYFIQEELILHFSQVDIEASDFERNFEETQATAEFDWSLVNSLEWYNFLPYINYEVSPIGELIIPTIDLRLPVLQGTTDANITLGAGTMAPGLVMGEGNFSLASHWDPSPAVRFGGLHLIELGDLIIMRDANYLYIYETVIANYVIEDYRVDIVDYVEDKVYVTLMTCTPDGLQRVMVRGELSQQVALTDLAELEMLFEQENLETITQVVATLDYHEIPFPTLHVVAVIGGSFLLATFVVWFSNRAPKRT